MVHAVELTPNLDSGYLELLDDEFSQTHHWPDWMISDLTRGLSASRKIRHQVTSQTAVLVLPDTPDAVIGFVSVKRLGVGNEPFQVGLQIHANHRNTGIVSELLPIVVEQLERAGFTEVALSTSKGNKAMVRVCNKLGYKHAAVQYGVTVAIA